MLCHPAARTQRIAPLAASPQLVAARRAPMGGWELVCIRYGRLAGSSVSPRGSDPMPYVEALKARKIDAAIARHASQRDDRAITIAE